MLAIKTLMASAALAATLPVMASQVTLSFEGLPSATRVGEAYSAKGIHFANDAFNFLSAARACGGSGNFYGGNTTAVGCNAVELYTGSSGGSASFYITVDAGFTGLFSVLYTAASAGSVSLYDSLEFLTDADAKPLSDQRSLNRQSTVGCATGFVCNWDTRTVDLGTQTAKYIVFSGDNGSLFLDNITFSNVNDAGGGGGTVPEPTGVALSLAALGALAYTRKRIQR